jgi:phenylacetic acid degradation operon negative regulatory protein
MHDFSVWPFCPVSINAACMKAKTEELLYLLLWTCDMLSRPTFRNLTDSFESWAYRNGFHRQLADLERQSLLESSDGGGGPAERVRRLTEAGRLHALGGRDPEACWRRKWDGRWRLVLFDLPAAEGTARNRLRNALRERGFGWLQNSVWISPHPMPDQAALLAGAQVNVESLLCLEARPSAGETDEEIVAGAWDFAEIDARYARHLQIIEACHKEGLRDAATAEAFLKWAARERAAWLEAVSADPLLPERLLPPGYLGQKAWRARVATLRAFAEQMRSFSS